MRRYEKLKPDHAFLGAAKPSVRQSAALAPQPKLRNGVPLLLPKPGASKPDLRVVNQLRDEA